MMQEAELQKLIMQATGAAGVCRGEVIQSLWSGYGEIVRYHVQGTAVGSIVVKHVRIPDTVDHPRGWHSDHAHARKLRSYAVEMHWYRNYAGQCDRHCRVARCFSAETRGDEQLILLEDLDAGGFSRRIAWLEREQIKVCLHWLAYFHARFMHEEPVGLWPTGSYWHLATRPDELAAMNDDALREAAPVIDALLSGCHFQSLVHGDAKAANFCFTDDGRSVAAVDFQYVGGGCGMKDVAYFLGGCLPEAAQDQDEPMLVEHYFSCLRRALEHYGYTGDVAALEAEWRRMLPLAHADFYRFLQGWMPDHRKVNARLRKIVRDVLRELAG